MWNDRHSVAYVAYVAAWHRCTPQNALGEDTHPLAKLSRGALTAALATWQDSKSFVDQLKGTLKSARGQLDEGSYDQADQEPIESATIVEPQVN